MVDSWELEDILQEAGVFTNGITGKQCHSDSYMTCVEYKPLFDLLSLVSDADKPRWVNIAKKEWMDGPSIALKMVARLVIRKFG